MVKTILFVRRRPDLSHEQFREHYETRHAPLAVSVCPLIRRYVRNYFAPVEGRDWPFDVMTEFWFDSTQDRAATRNFAMSPAGEVLAADEARFMDRASMTTFHVDERETNLPPAPAAPSARR